VSAIPRLLVLNCSHPLDASQLEALSSIGGAESTEVLEPDLRQLDLLADLAPQVAEAMSTVPLTSREWETVPMVVVLPALSAAAAVVVAEVHGRSGHFPTVVQLIRSDSPIPRYEVRALIGLQGIRDAARKHRTHHGGWPNSAR